MDFVARPYPVREDLKRELKTRRIPYWQVRQATGCSEFKISRMLSGLDPMRPDFERKLWEHLARHDRLLDQALVEEVDGLIGGEHHCT